MEVAGPAVVSGISADQRARRCYATVTHTEGPPALGNMMFYAYAWRCVWKGRFTSFCYGICGSFESEMVLFRISPTIIIQKAQIFCGNTTVIYFIF